MIAFRFFFRNAMKTVLFKNVLLNGAETDILIAGNRFGKIAPALSLPAGTPDAEIVDGKNLAVLPSFCNAHTHAAMTMLRGYADDMALFDWLFKNILPAEDTLTAEDIYCGSRLAALEMIRSGTTFFNDMYFMNGETARAARELGMRAEIAMTFVDAMEDERREKMFAQLAALPFGGNADGSGRVRFSVAAHAVYTVSEKLWRRCADVARERGLRLHIHLSETKKEVDDCVAAHGLSPVRWLDSLGVLGGNVVAAHGVWLDDEEIALLRERGVTLVHNPASNMKLASGIFRGKALSRAGCRVALGTDGAASNNNLDMREEMKLAALLAKVSGDPEAVPAGEVFGWATRGGFRAFGIDAGEIAEGKLADAVFVDLRNERLVPNHNLISNWVYAADARGVRHVLCDGNFLMRDGVVPGEEEIVEAARRAPFLRRKN